MHKYFKEYYVINLPLANNSGLNKSEIKHIIQYYRSNIAGGQVHIPGRWSKETSCSFLEMHQGRSKPFVFQGIDWNPKARDRSDDLEEVDLFDCGEPDAQDTDDRMTEAKLEPQPPADPPLDEKMKVFIHKKWKHNPTIEKRVLESFEDLKKGLNTLAINAPEWMADHYPEWMEFNHPELRKGMFKRN